MSITQSGSTFSGQFADTFSNPQADNGGAISGSVTGSQFTGKVTSVFANSCGFSVKGSVNGTTLSGTYKGVDCSVSVNGTFSVTVFVPPSVAGAYTGTQVDSVEGSGPVSATVTQTGSVLGGTYSNPLGSGRVYGQFVNSATAFFVLIPSVSSDCPAVATASMSPPNISGGYVGVDCVESDSGTFSLSM
jgi:hypothetical protein